MKIQEVILRAVAGKLQWWQAAEIVGVSCRTMRRWRWRYQHHGYDGLYDRRKGKPSPKRVPLETVEQVLQLYRQRYADHNVRHFHQKLIGHHGIRLSYSWVGGVGRQSQDAKGSSTTTSLPAAAGDVATHRCQSAWLVSRSTPLRSADRAR